MISSCTEALGLLENCINDADKLLEPQQKEAIFYKKLAKQLYKYTTKSQNGQTISSKALPKLLIDGFDEEQIWQQLELKNIPALKYYQKCVKEFNPDVFINSYNKNISETDLTSTKESICDISLDESDNDYKKDDYVFDDDSDNDSNSSIAEQFEEPSNKSKVKTKSKKSIIDDKFFKQSEIEEFLNLEDLKFEKEADGKDLATDESQEIDWGMNYSDDSDAELTEEKPSKDLMYADFFDPPHDSENDSIHAEDINNETQEDDDIDEEETISTKNRIDYDTRDYESNEDDGDAEESKMEVEDTIKRKNLFDDTSNYNDNEENESKIVVKTAFQKQQEKEQKRIKEMEDKLLQPKPWQLTGQVDASSRPTNSLMKQPTTFDVNVRQNIELTEDLTGRIEEIIRLAISNKAWNDVELKIKPKENTAIFKRLEPLDQTKSKKSLAEVYEDDYLKLKNKQESEEDPRHTEILKLMDELTPELYALFSHIPKPPVPEIKMVNNMPAITVEEIAPIGLSDAALLAPEEVKKKPKGDLKGETEKSITDKKRERRKKKVFQKLKQKKKEEKLKELAITNPALAKKQEKLLAIKKLKQSKNAVIAKSDKTKVVKSSKDFFARLEETVSKRPIKSKH